MKTSQDSPLILIADDDPTTQLLAEEMLSARGFRVVVADDGDKAMVLFAQYRPDAVLLDVRMPKRSGIDVCACVRTEHDDRVPIIMITGGNDADTVKRAYDAGANDFVSKPVNWATLPYRVEHAIRTRELSDTLDAHRGRTRTILDALPDDLLVIDDKGLVVEVLSGPTRAKQSPMPFSLEDFLPESAARSARDTLLTALRTLKPQSFEYERDQGRQVVEARIVPESKTLAVVILRDVTQRHRSEQRIRRLAYYDSVTGLPNRQLFVRELRRAMRHAKRTNTNAAILYVDLDRFKRINDTLGHSVGDALLKAVAQRLASCIRPSDFLGTTSNIDIRQLAEDHDGTRQLARLGGDEFVVLLSELDVRETAGAVAARVRKALAAPFTYEKRQFVVTPSIGIATYPTDGKDVETLLMRADTAMYQAKSSGRNTVRFYSKDMDASALERLDLEEDLRRAVDNDELRLAYQGKVALDTGAITGAEALLRWHHPKRGWISPAQFVALAEETGLIVPIGNWVIEQACEQLKLWQDQGLGDLVLSVNVSAEQFARCDIADIVLRTAREHGVEPNSLQLEITETLFMQDATDVKAMLTKLKDAGVSLAMDDFGTGYSSLGYLQQFPLDAIKIDRSFVLNLHRDGDNAAICAAIIAMSSKLGLRVIAEGIELEEQRDFLADAGCDEGQGFLFSKPVAADEFEVLVKAWRTAGHTLATDMSVGLAEKLQ
ncbi:MAG: EAL domain-containing protein [Pseudomonadota bacterium]